MSNDVAGALEELHVVFDGPPSHESGRFVEVESAAGRSVSVGEWRKRADGYWELVLSASDFRSPPVGEENEKLLGRIEILKAALLEARGVFQEYVRLHRAKNPPDEEKAQRNLAHADAIGNALAATRPAITEDVVERVARAIVKARNVDPDASMRRRVAAHGRDSDFEHAYFMWEDAIEEARAAISAMTGEKL